MRTITGGSGNDPDQTWRPPSRTITWMQGSIWGVYGNGGSVLEGGWSTATDDIADLIYAGDRRNTADLTRARCNA